MGAIYFAILERIERRGYDVFSEVVRVPRRRRAVIAAGTWAKTIAGL
jgi:phytoene/squalene synthetase